MYTNKAFIYITISFIFSPRPCKIIRLFLLWACFHINVIFLDFLLDSRLDTTLLLEYISCVVLTYFWTDTNIPLSFHQSVSSFPLSFSSGHCFTVRSLPSARSDGRDYRYMKEYWTFSKTSDCKQRQTIWASSLRNNFLFPLGRPIAGSRTTGLPCCPLLPPLP